MDQFICDHSKLIIPILLFIVVLNLGIIGFFFRKYFINRIDKIFDKLDTIQTNHDNCQKDLPVVYAHKADVEKIFEKIDLVVDKMSNLYLVFRTKDEAAKEWRLLEQRLTGMESARGSMDKSNAERHREIWDKLNRMVDFIKDERDKIEQRLNGVIK